MTQKFRLKKETRKYFDEKYHYSIQDLKQWQSECIRKELLDEVEQVYVDYGHEYRSSSLIGCKDLSGWESKDNKANFKFTINILDIKHSVYEKINISELMDEIQKSINKYVKTCIK